MAITSLDDYIGSTKQILPYYKSASRASAIGGWFSLIDLAGQPGAGALAGTSTAAGVVPTDATSGMPPINSFSGGTGYLSRVTMGVTVIERIVIYDLLFKAGAYAYNDNTALSSQPSYSGRLPGGVYQDTEIWVEEVTLATGNLAVTVTYTNQGGTGSRSTGAVGIGAAPTVGRCWRLPLQAGDTGVQKIDNVQGTVASGGTFNVLVLRRLWASSVSLSTIPLEKHGLFKTGLPEVFDTSAIFVLAGTKTASSGVIDMTMEIARV